MRKFVGVLVLFVLINIVVVGSQIIPRLGSYWRLMQIDQQLEAVASQIDVTEKDLEPIMQQVNQIEQQLKPLRIEIESLETDNPNGIPEKIYDAYSTKEDEYNLLIQEYDDVTEKHQPRYEDYSRKVDQYNALVEQRNSLEPENARIWFIMPRPGAFR